MKCKSCGADYKTRELKCPYCGTENVIGRIWLIERSAAYQEYEEAKERVRRKSRIYVFDKVLNRILLVSTALFLLCIILCFAVFAGYELYRNAYRSIHGEEIEHTMEEYYTAGEYRELYKYMSKYDLFGLDHYAYSQAAFLSFDYDFYKTEALCFLSQSEEEKQEYDYYLRSAIEYSHDVWHLDAGLYSEPDPNNVEMHETYKKDIMAFWKGMLGMKEEEIEFLTEGEEYLSSKELDDLIETIRKRRAWV